MADAATLVYDIDSSQAVGAAKALALMGQAAGKAAIDSAKLEKQVKKVDGSFVSFNDIAKKNAPAIRSLADEFNPLLAAQLKYADAEVRGAQAVALGVRNKDEMKVILAGLKTQYDAAAVAQQRFGASADVARHHAMNLSYQLNDIGMMMSLGQNPFALMMQQGPQVAQIMSQITAEGGKIGPTLAGAFASVINPVTLVTLAVIGGTAALYQWATSADEADKKAGKFSDRLSDLKSQIELVGEDFTFNIQTGMLEANVDQIVTKYGSLNDAVRTHINLLNEAAAAAAGYASIDLMAAFSETFGNGWLTTQIDEVRIAFDTTNDEARRLIYMMDNIQKAEGISNQRDAAIALRDEIYRMTGGIENMTAKQVAFALQVNQTVDALTQAEVQLNRNTASAQDAALATAQWAANTGAVVGHLQNAANLLASIGGGAIQRASRAAQSAALAAGATTTQIAAAGARAESIGQLQKALQSKQITIEEYARLRAAVDEEAAAWSSLNTQIDGRAAAEREAAKADKASASSGKAAAKAAAAEIRQAENKFQSLRELLEKETIFNFAEYEKRQTQLDLALQKKLITEQNYEAMRQQLRTYYFGSEFEQNALQRQLDQEALQSALNQKLITYDEYYRQLREMQFNNLMSDANRSDMAQDLSNTADYFGRLNALTGNNYDKLAKLQKTFAASAAFINAYLAASQTLADPTLGFWGKMAAYGTVLAAGLGLVGAIKGGGSGGGRGGSSGSSAPAVAPQAPVQNVLVNLTGDQWLVDMAGEVIDQISEQSRNGRVIIQRDRGN